MSLQQISLLSGLTITGTVISFHIKTHEKPQILSHLLILSEQITQEEALQSATIKKHNKINNFVDAFTKKIFIRGMTTWNNHIENPKY